MNQFPPSYHILKGNLELVGPDQPLVLEETAHAKSLEPDDASETQFSKHGSKHQSQEPDQEPLILQRCDSSKISDQCDGCYNSSDNCTG